MKFNPPTGLARLIARFPILLYRFGLGWILGERFLLLYHLGRKSGKTRKVVLEVLHHEPRDGSYLIASGWGERSDWYKNLKASKTTEIEVAGRKIPVMASFLNEEEARRELERYAQKHPWASRLLFMVFKSEKVETWSDMARQFRLVRLLRYTS